MFKKRPLPLLSFILLGQVCSYDCHSFIEQELHKGADAELQVGQNQTAPAFLGTPFATPKEPVHSR